MKRPIAISLSPNTLKDDVDLSLKVLFRPWTWLNKTPINKLDKKFERMFPEGFRAISTNSGRSAQYIALKALGIGPGDEVVIQAFTCVAVPNSIMWLGAKPIYVDVDSNFNIDVTDLSKKITPKTKAIICQHTFGVPANIEKIKEIAGKDVILIEDCAHSLGGIHNEKQLGTFGKVSFFSFGRDKVISSVFGGMVLTKDKRLYKKIKTLIEKLEEPSRLWILQQLLHPTIFNYLVLPLYNVGPGKYGIGKIILFVSQKLKLLSKPVYIKEQSGNKPNIFPQKLPGALAELAINQLNSLNVFIKHRKHISKYYMENIENITLESQVTYLRVPVLVKKRNDLINYAKTKGILLGNWYNKVVVPTQDERLFGYKKGSCTNAERFSNNIINLPTYPTLTIKEAGRVVEIINKWQSIK